MHKLLRCIKSLWTYGMCIWYLSVRLLLRSNLVCHSYVHNRQLRTHYNLGTNSIQSMNVNDNALEMSLFNYHLLLYTYIFFLLHILCIPSSLTRFFATFHFTSLSLVLLTISRFTSCPWHIVMLVHVLYLTS